MAKVLLVDDEASVLFTLEQVLQEEGLQTLSARSGAEALALLPQASVVVTDLAMPGMDGLALLHAVREQDAALPVVLLTAHGSERVAVQAMRAGAYDYLAKPFDNDELVLTVRR